MLKLKRKIYDLFRFYILGPYRGQVVSDNARFRENIWLKEDFSYLNEESQINNWLDRFEPRVSKLGLFSWDYPFVFWMQKIKKEDELIRVADYGGANGALFDRVKDFIPVESWCVHDLPQLDNIIAEKYKEDSRVFFKERWCDILNYNVLVSYSTLQYILDSPLNDFFKKTSASCKYVVINRVPVTFQDEFIGSQFIDSSRVTPIKISNISEYMSIPGWNLLDIWYDDLDKSDRVTFSDKEYTFIGAIYCRIE